MGFWASDEVYFQICRMGGSMRDPRDDGIILYPDYVSVNILVIFYYNFSMLSLGKAD